MDFFNRDDLRELLADDQAPCVSVFLPTTRGARMEDQLRLKNHLRAAEERLQEQVRRTPEARDLLRPGQALVEDVPFWREVSEGLALFLSRQTVRCYRLPWAFDDLVVVGKRFHVLPLLPLLNGKGHFFVLVLHHSTGVRLLQATQRTAREVDLYKVPAGLHNAPRYQDGEWRGVAVHEPPGLDPAQQAIIPGPGIMAGENRDDILRYYHQADLGLRRLLQNDQAPLVLAGSADLAALYQQANTYRHLLPERVEAHLERMSAEELRDKAWEKIQAHFDEARQKVLGLYQQLGGTGRTTHDLAEVVAAAYQGRLQYLFAARDRPRWGTLDPATGRVEARDRQEAGDEDLLNVAAFYTLSHGGSVYPVEPDQAPDGGPLAGIYWLPIGERSGQRTVEPGTQPA